MSVKWILHISTHHNPKHVAILSSELCSENPSEHNVIGPNALLQFQAIQS